MCPFQDGWLAQGSQSSQSSLETGQSRAQNMPALSPEMKRVDTCWLMFYSYWHPTLLLHDLSWPQFPQLSQGSINLKSL